MSYKVTALAAALVAAAPASAAEWAQQESPELCVLYAMTLVTGQPYQASSEELSAELKSRGETCTPAEVYMSAAVNRLKLIQLGEANRERVAQQAEQQAAIDDDLERRERQERMLRTLQIINQQYQKPAQTPQRTTCRPDGIGGVTCTSW